MVSRQDKLAIFEMNRLAGEKAAYLKHSAHQKIDWYPWSDEAFDRARQEDKPVFLSSGAIWCHWCHVMAKECFEDEEIIRLLNENFINIKLDRDERPDIDRKYQQAVAAMSSGGGWPLSVFLTPEKRAFFGGTYFPPVDSYGRPGFKTVLRTVIDFYRTKKEEASDYAERLTNSLKKRYVSQDKIDPSLRDEAVKNIISEFDPQNGGFGTAPKFPMPGAMEFLINRYFLMAKRIPNEKYSREDFARETSPLQSIAYVTKKTLEAMAKGGFHDQIGGGFHRYATDEAWIIPHFEKLADDNAWLLRNYINAYSVFGSEYFREVAEGIIHFIRNELSDSKGGFYSSQDADVTPDDEGGYFTWTEEDFRRVLDDEEYEILSLHLLHDRGSMHHDSSKKALFVAMEPDEIVKELGIDKKKVIGIIARGKGKLLRERKKRERPFIDTTLYTSLNGMFISAYLSSFRVLRDKYLKDFALMSLKRIAECRIIDNELFHSEGVKALVDDYIYLIDAFVEAYEATGDSYFLHRADGLMDICIKKFWDKDEGGFFDTETDIVGLRLKGIEDIPHPSPNAVGILSLLKLYHLTDKQTYYQYAGKALRTFYSTAKDLDIHAGYYFVSLDAYFNTLRLTVYARPESELAHAAFFSYSPYTVLTYADDRGYILPCFGTQCYEPVYSIEELRKFLREKEVNG